MADGNTNLQFTANKGTGEFEITTYSHGKPIASCKFTLNEAGDFITQLAKAFDEVASAQQRGASKLILPATVN